MSPRFSRLVCILMVAAAVPGFSNYAFAQRYDVVLKGGRVLDPGNNIDAVMDVAIAGGKIARVAADIPAGEAKRAVNVSGLYVTPGLVDLHVHVNAGGPHLSDTNFGVFPDDYTFRSGVTTVVDAGSTGWQNFPDFKRRVIDRAGTRVLALLNIVGLGMENRSVQQDVRQMDAAATAKRAQEFPNEIVGIKTAHYVGPEWAALDRAIEAAKIANLPVMVDYGGGHLERPFAEALRRMRPGDMYTHMYGRPRPTLDERGQVRAEFREARARGVLFDVGHGAGSLLFRHVIPALAQGWLPDSISTDLYSKSVNAGMKDFLNVLSKFLNMGMSVPDVIRRATLNPAKQIRRSDIGRLTVGAEADVAVLRLRKGNFGFIDVGGARLSGTQLLECEMTFRRGKLVWELNGLARDDWRKLPDNYEDQGDPSWDATILRQARRPR